MKTFEIKVITTTLTVYRVEAEDKDEAEDLYDYGEATETEQGEVTDRVLKIKEVKED